LFCLVVVPSSLKDRGEGCFQVANVGRDGGGRARLAVVGGLELRTFVLHHLSLERLLRVLHVPGEPVERSVVTAFGRVRWLERLVVNHGRLPLVSGLSLRDLDVLTDDVLSRVENVSTLHLL